MEFELSDIGNNAVLFTLICTGLIALIIEAARKNNPAASYYVCVIGLLLSAGLAFSNLSVKGQSYYGMIQYGGYTNFFSMIFCGAALLTIVFARDYLKQRHYNRGEFYILLLFATVGMILIAAANDLIVVFLGIELMSICLYVLTGFIRTKERAVEAAMKYFILGAFSTGFLLYGIALIYGAAGTTNLLSIRNVSSDISSNYLFVVGVGLLIVGLAFKVAAVPFHMWVPDVYEGAPTTVTAFMSTGAKAAAFAALITVCIRTSDLVGVRMNELLAILAAASMILGNIIAIAQTNIKRMLAYSSIAHAGYILAGVAAGTPDGQIAVMFYLVAYAIMNLGAFAIVGFVEREDDQTLSFDDYKGFNHSHPLLAAPMAVFMFALAGIPPFAGFFGKYYVFFAVIHAKMTWLAIIGVLTSLLSAYYYLRLVVLMYFYEGKSDIAAPSRVALAFVLACAIMVLVFGLFPSLIVQTAQQCF